jgi:hypothetical protein
MALIRSFRDFLIVVTITFLGTVPAFSQKIKLNASLDTTAILIGDQLTFTIEVEQPKNVIVNFPILADSLTSKIEIVKASPADTTRSDNNLIIRKKYLITSFDSGYYKIPAYKFPFSLNNVTDTLTSQELYLTVNTLPVDTAKEIMDIKPVMSTPFSFKEIKKELLIGFVILIAIALIIWVLIRQKKNKPLFAPKKIKEPAHVVALRDLDKLRAEKLWQNNQIKTYYTRITDILRVYILERFGINAMEMTSDEILSTLEHELNTDMELKSSFTKLLQLADMVKFAKEEPLPQENDVALLNAYTFVNRTKIEVAPSIPENSSLKNDTVKE